MKLKLKLITFVFLLPLYLLGQNTTFESVFQTLKNRETDSNEICHFSLTVKITPNVIEVTQVEKDKIKLLFSFPVLFETTDNNIFAYTEDDATAVFNLDEKKLTIVNSKMLWVIYGKIPATIKLD